MMSQINATQKGLLDSLKTKEMQSLKYLKKNYQFSQKPVKRVKKETLHNLN
jgi:hypothetical protein